MVVAQQQHTISNSQEAAHACRIVLTMGGSSAYIANSKQWSRWHTIAHVTSDPNSPACNISPQWPAVGSCLRYQHSGKQLTAGSGHATLVKRTELDLNQAQLI